MTLQQLWQRPRGPPASAPRRVASSSTRAACASATRRLASSTTASRSAATVAASSALRRVRALGRRADCIANVERVRRSTRPRRRRARYRNSPSRMQLPQREMCRPHRATRPPLHRWTQLLWRPHADPRVASSQAAVCTQPAAVTQPEPAHTCVRTSESLRQLS